MGFGTWNGFVRLKEEDEGILDILSSLLTA